MRLIRWNNIEQLRQRSAAWDDLWQASDVAAPTARAAMLAIWLEHFGANDRFICLAVEQDGALCAALPLVQTRIKGLLPSGGAVANCWSSAGQLLIDPLAPDSALDLLASGLNDLPWPLLWLEGIHPASSGWSRFLAACTRAGLEHHFRHDADIGLIDIDCDWQSYLASRSSNHAKNLRKARKRLESQGEIDFHRFRIDEEDQAEQLLHRALEIECRSWKAAGGTPTIVHPIALSFFAQQARQLAAWGALEISFLELDGRPIAFEYGYRGKGVHLAHKSGYDDAFSDVSPGHLLMGELLKTFHNDQDVQLVDCLGPLSLAMSRWTTRTSREGRLLLAPSGLLGRAAWCAYRCAVSIR